MSNVYVNDIGVPRIARNKRIYSGNNAIEQTSSVGGGTIIDWATVTQELIEFNRSVQVDGDITVTNLAGNDGDIVFVDANGMVGTLHLVWGEVPTGAIDNSNKDFVLANTPVDWSVSVYLNGQRLKLTTDYTIMGDTITLNIAPYSDANYTDIITADYNYVTYTGTSIPSQSDVGYTAMTRGSACQSSGFDLKISRIKKTMTITGIFSTIVAPATGSIIASIPYATVAQGYELSTPIYGMDTTVDALDANRGVRFYVDAFDSGSTNIEIKVLNARDNVDAAITLTFNLI